MVITTSTISVHSNLVLASQLAKTNIVEDYVEEVVNEEEQDVTEETVNEEEQDVAEETVNEEEQDVTEETVNEEEQGVTEETVNEEEQGVAEETVNEEEQGVAEETVNEEEQGVTEETVNEEEQGVTEETSNIILEGNNGLNESLNNIKNETLALDDLFIINSEGVITGFNSGTISIKDLVIPVAINEKVITGIGNNVFVGREIYNLSFEEGSQITSIGDYAFQNTRISSVTFPSSLKSIGKNAFENTFLTSVTIPSNIEKIGNNAFKSCENLQTVTIKDGACSIGDYAFSNCTALNELTFEGGLSDMGKYAFSNIAIKTLTINEHIKKIGNSAFTNCTKLETILINGDMESIGSSAFSNCTSLDTVTIEGNVDTIGSSAFYSSSQRQVEIKGSVGTIGSSAFSNCTTLETVEIKGNVGTIGSRAFSTNYTLANISVLGSINSIGDYAFEYCRKLSTISFNEGLTSIGNNVFQSCSLLEKVELPSTIQTIGKEAFYRCEALKTFGTTGNIEENKLIIKDGITIDENVFKESGIEEVVILEGVKEIPTSIFRQCSKLTKVTIPNTLTTIGNSAFIYCSNLVTVGTKDNIEEDVINIHANVTNILDSAFFGTGIKELKIHSTKENPISIGAEAFITKTLLNVEIGHAKTIGASAFQSNISSYKSVLEKVTIDSVETIGASAFNYCSKLATLTIGSVETIGASAFYSCGLTTLKIDSIKTIEKSAFSSCIKLKQFDVPSEILSISENSFYDFRGTINIPQNKIESGLTKEYLGVEKGLVIWNDTYNGDDYIVDIDGYLQKHNGSETNITIPSTVTNLDGTVITVTEIGNCAFYAESSYSGATYNSRNYYIQSIVIPDTITKIGKKAFHYCKNLTTVTMPSGDNCKIESIGSEAFYSCEKLSKINLPETISEIKFKTFYNCKGLENITIPKNIEKIGSEAFLNAGNIWIPDKEIDTISGSKWGAKAVYWKDTYPDKTGNFVIFVDNENNTGEILAYIGESEDVVIDSILEYDNSFVGGELGKTKAIKSVTITSIGKNAFYGNSIVSVKLPETVNIIKQSAFERCYKLKTINLENVETIENYGFKYCTKLEDVNISSLKDVINEGVFYDCEALRNLTIPSTVSFLNISALSSVKLENLTIDQSDTPLQFKGTFSKDNIIKNLYINRGMTIPKNLFSYNYHLKTVTIGKTNSPVVIETSAFSNSRYLESINIQDEGANVVIKTTAFAGCTGLKKLDLPGRVQDTQIDGKEVYGIGSSAFLTCYNLKEINISEDGGDLSLGPSAFGMQYFNEYNRSLSTLNIPERVKYIGGYNFENYKSLKIVDIKGEPELGTNIFENSSNLETINLGSVKNIPSNMFLNCSSLTNIQIPETVSYIGEKAFSGCKSLKELSLPDSITNIESGAFYNCEQLEYIKLPNITTINSSVFYGCKSLKKLELPESITKIDNMAFYNCEQLEYIQIPGVTNIGTSAFSGCISLKTVEIPEKTTIIGDNAFLNCKDLETIYILQTRKPPFDGKTWGSNATVYFLGEFISTEHLKTERIDSTKFNVELFHNGYKQMVILGVTDYKNEKINYANETERYTRHTIKIDDFDNLSKNIDYTFYTHGQITDNSTGEKLDTKYKKSIKVEGFVSYLDRHTNTHLEDIEVDKVKYKYGQKITLPQNIASSTFELIGWENADTGQIYSLNNPIKYISGNINLYPVFNYRNPKVELKFNPNYTGANIISKYTTRETQVQLESFIEAPVREGYQFTGWYLDSNATQKAEESFIAINDMEFYAGWIKIVPTDPTTEEKPEVTTKDEPPVVTEEQTEGTTKDEPPVVTEEQTEGTTKDESLVVTEEQTEVTTKDETSVVTEEQTEVTTKDETSVVTEEQTEVTTKDESPVVTEEQTEATTEDNTNSSQFIPVEGGNNSGNNGENIDNGNNSEYGENNIEDNVNVENNIYTFGNLEIITPEHQQMAREAIKNISFNERALNDIIYDLIENVSNNGDNINQKRLTEKPAFGFSKESNISLLILLLLLLIVLIGGYTIKKQLIDKEKDKNKEDCEDDLSLEI